MKKIISIFLFSILPLLITGCPVESTQSTQNVSSPLLLPVPLPPIFPECCVPCQSDVDCKQEECDTAKKDGYCVLGTGTVGLCAW